MRMRPDANATDLTIRIGIDIDSISTVVHSIDSVVLRAIRPQMDWVNGSIADTAVSTGGRSFNWGQVTVNRSSLTCSKTAYRA